MHCRVPRPRGLTIIEALVLLIVCSLLALVVVPVVLVRMNILEPDTDVASPFVPSGEKVTPPPAPPLDLPEPAPFKLPEVGKKAPESDAKPQNPSAEAPPAADAAPSRN